MRHVPSHPGSTKRRPRGAHGRAAFTLVEAALAVLIVGGVLLASVRAVGGIGQARRVQVERATAMHLADQLMAEILQAYYQDPQAETTPTMGVDAGETGRAQFDDVDDYDAHQASPVTRNGASVAGYTGWIRKVEVRRAALADPSVDSAVETRLKRIKVTVISASGTTVSTTALRSTNGPYEQTPSATTNYLTYTGVSAQVGDRGRTVHGAGHPLNVTTSQ
jgi:hypothetical protein